MILVIAFTSCISNLMAIPIPGFPWKSLTLESGAREDFLKCPFPGFPWNPRNLPGNRLQGPAIILEYGSTTFVPADFKVHIDEWQNLVMEPLLS